MKHYILVMTTCKHIENILKAHFKPHMGSEVRIERGDGTENSIQRECDLISNVCFIKKVETEMTKILIVVNFG